MLTSYLLAFCRIVVGLVFAASFLTKSRDIAQFAQVVSRFDLLPKWSSKFAAIVFLSSEFAIVALITLGGRFLTLAFALAAILLPLFAAALILVLLRNIQAACNCFGSSEQIVSIYDVWRNIGFTLCAVMGLGLCQAFNAVEMHLALAELALVGFAAGAFVLLWMNLGEVMTLFHAN